MRLFNELFARENIDPAGVLALRHTPLEPKLKKALPWLAAKQPDIFNAYQQTQDEQVEADMLKAQYVASFIGLEKRKGAELPAVFIGLYKVGDHWALTYEDFRKIPAYQELKKKFDLRGMKRERPPLCGGST